jgi:hypothetical protein
LTEEKNMKTINIDGKEYVLKSDVDKKLKESKTKFHVIRPYGITDPAHVMAMGTVKLGSKARAVLLSFDYLVHAIKALKEFQCDQVVLAIVSEEHPLVIGREIDEDNRLSGIVIAPRIESKEND